jgi:hypothetical protein
MISKIRAALGGCFYRAKTAQALRSVLRQDATEHSLAPWSSSLADPTGYYLDCVRVFHGKGFPRILKRHRAYFHAERRGFGEDAFHVMWWMIFRELRPSRFLEVGVYRGQTLSLAALLQREFAIHGSVTGISPFAPSGDTVSRYREDVNYLADTKLNFNHFGLPEPELVRAFSTDAVARERVERETWDAIYIDGNHDYEVARADWDLCGAHVRAGGIIVLDDSALGTAYNPPAFATGGHPGPSQVAAEIEGTSFREILRVGHNRVFKKLC